MKIELASARQILVELDRADLCAYHLTVEQLGAPDAQTRRLLQQILAAASGNTGQVYQLRQYSRVDVLPDKTGGCLLILSDCEKRRAPSPLCFFSADFDALVDLARKAGKDGAATAVTLLQTQQGFFVFCGPLGDQTRRLFAEYLQPLPLPEGAQWVLRERGKVLLERAPLSVLGGGS